MNVPAERTLVVWVDQQRVGELRERGNLWTFAYDAEWLDTADAFALSPSLPLQREEMMDGATQRPVQWFFDNLLPEEGERALLAHDVGVDAADAFGLLQRYGPESAGALTLLAPGVTLPDGDLQALSDEALSKRIQNLPRLPLSHDAPKRMSMAGAQHKLAVVLAGGQLFEPVGRVASTHILKPNHPRPDDYPHSAVNEWFVMCLAHRVGLNVPSVSLRRVPEPIYLVQRFDREGESPDVRRRHVLDACQLLSIDHIFKYQQATAENLRELAERCRSRAATRQAIFRWSVFNLLVGNGDAHLKNLSFFPSAQGIELAPHYDLLSTSIYREAKWRDAELITPIGQARRFGEVRPADIHDFGRVLGLPAAVSQRLLNEMLARFAQHAKAWLERCESDQALGLLAGEAMLLRQIVHGAIKDMAQQLS
ncbi:HipA domain-containing protein [Dyella flava]|uniref:HipA domain-containing protein n=1 Tax=Dyella flava TaxID=1920170 RepID=A0ABS2K9A2_9GAMM|nr:HipA domain-containing protein [Dyella flava]MBM7127519.1 HipA domain-containing protein [Dyella flava]GLQ51118.1 putative kinase Y4mE [Dyella flava]